LRIATIKARDAAQTAQHVTQVAPENSAVGVQLVEDDVTEVFEQARPACVVRQDASVQHVRIGQDDVAFFADGPSRVGRCVAVIRENAKAIVEALVEVVEFSELVLRESFGREEVERAAVGVFERRVQYRQVVTESFAGGRWSDNDHVFPGVDRFGRFGLMRIQAADPFGSVCSGKLGMHPSGEVGPLGLARGEMAHSGEEFAVVVARGEGIQDFVDAGEGRWDARSTNSQRFRHEK
jgi:hypothetical protein